MINLKCPSCGGELSVPDNLKVARCLYCGSKILLGETGNDQSENYENYIELCNSAIKAKNHNETIYYVNKILEINPKNIRAWINKSKAIWFLSTPENRRYDEAMSYLDKANEISPQEIEITKAKEEITNMQSVWLNNLGVNKLDEAIEYYRLLKNRRLDGERSTEMFIEAMNYFLDASDLKPYDETILKNIKKCRDEPDWIFWKDERINSRIRNLYKIEDMNDYKKSISRQKNKLVVIEQQLQELQKEMEDKNLKESRRIRMGKKEARLIKTIGKINRKIDSLESKILELNI